MPSLTSLYEVSRPRTTQKIHKARKKARLLKKDQKRLAEKEEWKKDPRKMVFGLLRKAGMKPGRQYAERAITITCTGRTTSNSLSFWILVSYVKLLDIKSVKMRIFLMAYTVFEIQREREEEETVCKLLIYCKKPAYMLMY